MYGDLTSVRTLVFIPVPPILAMEFKRLNGLVVHIPEIGFLMSLHYHGYLRLIFHSESLGYLFLMAVSLSLSYCPILVLRPAN